MRRSTSWASGSGSAGRRSARSYTDTRCQCAGAASPPEQIDEAARLYEAAAFATIGIPSDQVVRLESLGEPLKIEIQYTLQCRADERSSKTPPTVVM
ncbi:hypothetical protein OG320_24175 [Microbispora sp. NBC_01189]|uniref:hypothetical protein n=1 Tax=Microbispora sp. NBC_01189 TaxID=2903583 RepID=UPI002E0E10AF|nr:hypothetical protein OG320_24175 [Microbispora sp. NBC_01189]